MNINEVKQGLVKEIDELNSQCVLLQELIKIDVSKYDGKKLTKRIETHMNKFIGESRYLRFHQSYYGSNWEIYYSDKNSIVKIELTFYNFEHIDGGKAFSNEEYLKVLNQTLDKKYRDIDKLNQELIVIEDKCKEYNNLIDKLKEFEESNSYKLRDILTNGNYINRFSRKVRF